MLSSIVDETTVKIANFRKPNAQTIYFHVRRNTCKISLETVYEYEAFKGIAGRSKLCSQAVVIIVNFSFDVMR